MKKLILILVFILINNQLFSQIEVWTYHNDTMREIKFQIKTNNNEVIDSLKQINFVRKIYVNFTTKKNINKELLKVISNIPYKFKLVLINDSINKCKVDLGLLYNATRVDFFGEESFKIIYKKISNESNIKKIEISTKFKISLRKNLTTLEYLTIAGTSMKNIPNCISNCINLKGIDLRNNKIKKINRALTKLDSLEVLKINNNKLKSIPKHVKYLHKVDYLCIQNNSFKELPNEILLLPNIEMLRCGDVYISENLKKELEKRNICYW